MEGEGGGGSTQESEISKKKQKEEYGWASREVVSNFGNIRQEL